MLIDDITYIVSNFRVISGAANANHANTLNTSQPIDARPRLRGTRSVLLLGRTSSDFSVSVGMWTP